MHACFANAALSTSPGSKSYNHTLFQNDLVVVHAYYQNHNHNTYFQVRVADPSASVRHVEVAPGARKRFAYLVCLWGSSKDTLRRCCWCMLARLRLSTFPKQIVKLIPHFQKHEAGRGGVFTQPYITLHTFTYYIYISLARGTQRLHF